MARLNKDNIFLNTPYGTPHETVPFQKIRTEDYEEAVMEGMRQEDDAIQRIIDNPAEPTFENTLLPRTDELLSRVTTVFYNQLSAHTSDEMDSLADKLSPLLTEHSNRILMNPRLFERVKYVRQNAKGLNAEETMLLEKTYEGFERNGASLSDEDKKTFSALNVELAQLTLKFNQNNLKEINAYQLHITEKEKLKGLPESAIQAAAQAAGEKEVKGWLFTLHAPSYTPFMTYADDRELRRQMYMARNTICTQPGERDNYPIVKQIINLRRQIAQLLGYKTYAEYVLHRRMAQNTENVNNLIEKLLEAYEPKARQEVAEVESVARRIEGDDFQVQPWDFSYYSHKLKCERYDFDAEQLRPYFQLDKVKEGIFGLAGRLYGITFRRNKQIPVYHPDVEAYEVLDGDGSFLAVFYADFFPRDSKQSGAWMTSYQEQYIDEQGCDHRPHVSITMNLTKPTNERPSLLTLSEVETFLHEFGHALHGIFSKVHFEALSGTNVYWDFVELPSQFMENYVTEPEFLTTFARHYQTGEVLPTELIEKIRRSRNFLCGYACLRQLSFCLLDMAYYTTEEPFDEDILTFEHKTGKRTQLLPVPEKTCMSVQFSHIMSGGYAAGYYSYKWAEVLDADAFSLFQERGIFDRQTAGSFRNDVLSRGGTEPPMALYRRFRGKEPSIDALLKRNDILK
ncbi:MAG: M3 family metallopeptidase [Bacteroidaceae bacterium]|nr:M3 family metallopeptidase [Bacteroidaceae bacterium]